MSEFRLKNMLEYRYIIGKRGVIDAVISKLSYFHRPYTGVITDILTETTGDAFLKSYYGVDYQANLEKVNRRMSIFWTLTRSNLFKNIASDINSKAEKNFEALLLAANYSFAEYIFWNRCETEPAIAEYHAKDSVEELTASVIRKKAEETYKKGHTDQAVEDFKKALELTPDDFTILFQLGMYYFFEKADHIKAADFFARSAAGARGISARIEAMAYCFTSLIIRLKALHKGDRDMADDAMTIGEKAVRTDPDLIMTHYCSLQALAGLCVFEDHGSRFLKAAEKVFEMDYNLLLQAILDNAFDPVLDALISLAASRYDAGLSSCVKSIEETSKKISQFPSRLETSADTARVFNLQKEFKSVQEYFKKNKTYADIEETIKRIEAVSGEADRVLHSNRVQQMLIRVREYCSVIVNEYKKDFGDRLKPYNDALKRRGEIGAKIEALVKKYFITAESADTSESKEHSENGGGPKAPDKKADYTRNPEAEKSVKSKCASAVFFVFEAIIVFLWIFAGVFSFAIFAAASLITLCLIPAYSVAGAELFYFITRLQLDELKRDYSRVDLKLDLSNNLPGEAEMKARDKYSKQIAGEFGISQIDARNILEAALFSDYEKMKAAVRNLCR